MLFIPSYEAYDVPHINTNPIGLVPRVTNRVWG
jgi:hypothetical protein